MGVALEDTPSLKELISALKGGEVIHNMHDLGDFYPEMKDNPMVAALQERVLIPRGLMGPVSDAERGNYGDKTERAVEKMIGGLTSLTHIGGDKVNAKFAETYLEPIQALLDANIDTASLTQENCDNPEDISKPAPNKDTSRER